VPEVAKIAENCDLEVFLLCDYNESLTQKD
jgi:hypothetical protein